MYSRMALCSERAPFLCLPSAERKVYATLLSDNTHSNINHPLLNYVCFPQILTFLLFWVTYRKS